MSHQRVLEGRRGGVAGALLSALVGGLVITVLVLAAGLWYLSGKVIAATGDYLRKNVFTDPSKASFEKIGFHWLGGGLYLGGLQLHPPPANGVLAEVRVDEISVPLPLSELMSGAVDVTRVRVERPMVRVVISSAAAAKDDATAPASPVGDLSQIFKTPLSAATIKDGSVSIEYQGGAKPLVVEGIDVDFKREKDEGALVLAGQAQIAQSPKASLSVNVKLYEPDPAGHFEGEVKLNEIPIAALGGMLPPDPDVRYQSGAVTVKSQFNCKNGWLTASHLVDINDVKLDVAPARDKVFGISAKYLKDLDHISFDLPMSGSLSAPEIDFATSLRQILTKILREKFSDKEKADQLADFLANSIGGKLDKALKAWLKRRKK